MLKRTSTLDTRLRELLIAKDNEPSTAILHATPKIREFVPGGDRKNDKMRKLKVSSPGNMPKKYERSKAFWLITFLNLLRNC